MLPDVPSPTDEGVLISTVVTGLNPYTMYQFRAFGVNVLGEGRPSYPSGKSTLWCCRFISAHLFCGR